jgi:hypothetical protein
VTPPSLFRRVFANLSAVRGALERRLVSRSEGKPALVPSPAPARSAVTGLAAVGTADSNIEPVIAPAAEAPSLLVAEGNDDLDECEALLKRAIEIVQTPARPHAAPQTDIEPAPEPMTISSSEPQAEDAAPPLSVDSSEAETVAPESEARVAKTEIAEPVAATAALSEPAPASPVVVEIEFDSEKSRYIAKNIETGISVLRMSDLERLQQMCDRLGWQVVRVPDTIGTQR